MFEEYLFCSTAGIGVQTKNRKKNLPYDEGYYYLAKPKSPELKPSFLLSISIEDYQTDQNQSTKCYKGIVNEDSDTCQHSSPFPKM